MSSLLRRNEEIEFEREEREYKNEKALMRQCAYEEYLAEERLKRDMNRDWKNEDGDLY